MFEGGRRETFGFINDDQLNPTVPSDTALPVTVEAVMLFDTALRARRQQMQVFPEFTQGAADGWGIENRPRTRQGSIHVCIRGLARSPCVEQRFCQIPVGMAAGGEGFAHSGGTKTHTNRAMLA
jgi:hypothetical protein